MLILVTGTSFAVLRGLNSATASAYRDKQTSRALAEAKAALIGFASSYPDAYAATDPNAGPGFLPCPDTSDNGSPNPPCPVNAIGRLPWKFLGLSQSQDQSGERFWYALSGLFRNNPKRFPLNSETPGQLTVDGIADVVAVVIAPGSPVQTQTRPSSSFADYLEGANSDGDTVFGNHVGPLSNDIVIGLSRRELMVAAERRVLYEARKALTAYYRENKVYPFPVAAATGQPDAGCDPDDRCDISRGESCFFLPVDGACKLALPQWFYNADELKSNKWNEHIYYAVAPACTAPTEECSGSGFLISGSITGIHALVIAAGPSIKTEPFADSKGAAQMRPSLLPEDYLDSEENVAGEPNSYDAPAKPLAANYNDQILIVCKNDDPPADCE